VDAEPWDYLGPFVESGGKGPTEDFYEGYFLTYNFDKFI